MKNYLICDHHFCFFFFNFKNPNIKNIIYIAISSFSLFSNYFLLLYYSPIIFITFFNSFFYSFFCIFFLFFHFFFFFSVFHIFFIFWCLFWVFLSIWRGGVDDDARLIVAYCFSCSLSRNISSSSNHLHPQLHFFSFHFFRFFVFFSTFSFYVLFVFVSTCLFILFFFIFHFFIVFFTFKQIFFHFYIYIFLSF